MTAGGSQSRTVTEPQRESNSSNDSTLCTALRMLRCSVFYILALYKAREIRVFRAEQRSGDAVLNDSPVDCQTRGVTEPQRESNSSNDSTFCTALRMLRCIRRERLNLPLINFYAEFVIELLHIQVFLGEIGGVGVDGLVYQF